MQNESYRTLPVLTHNPYRFYTQLWLKELSPNHYSQLINTPTTLKLSKYVNYWLSNKSYIVRLPNLIRYDWLVKMLSYLSQAQVWVGYKFFLKTMVLNYSFLFTFARGLEINSTKYYPIRSYKLPQVFALNFTKLL